MFPAISASSKSIKITLNSNLALIFQPKQLDVVVDTTHACSRAPKQTQNAKQQCVIIPGSVGVGSLPLQPYLYIVTTQFYWYISKYLHSTVETLKAWQCSLLPCPHLVAGHLIQVSMFPPCDTIRDRQMRPSSKGHRRLGPSTPHL